MTQSDQLFLGASQEPQHLALKLANRHGLVAGATGTGKTVTLQILAEGFADAGVPVFCADVKGDLSGIAACGEAKDFLQKRADKIGFSDYNYRAYDTVFWDLFGDQGHPIRTTISEVGPLLLARLMDLNATQEGVLNIAFRLADDEGLLLLDLKDLRALLTHMTERTADIRSRYGNISSASIGAIQRQLLVLEQQGADKFFGEPALDIQDFMRHSYDGRGIINVLAADQLMMSPRLYATFLLWLLSELFEEMPEIGDPDKPKLVFFFDEAHLLFDGAPKVLLEKVEQVVRLIRSKGVGVYFVTQNPLDLPESVLAQLGNRFQHALRAYTPRERKAVKVAAETFRPNPEFDSFSAITELEVGEALVSTLEGKGVPSIVARTLIRPPRSRLGPLTADERAACMSRSSLAGKYDSSMDRHSAYEILMQRAEAKAREEEMREAQEAEQQLRPRDYYDDERRTGTGFTLPDFGGNGAGSTRAHSARSRGRSRRRQSTTESLIKSVVRAAGSQLGRSLMRGILGGLKRGF